MEGLTGEGKERRGRKMRYVRGSERRKVEIEGLTSNGLKLIGRRRGGI